LLGCALAAAALFLVFVLDRAVTVVVRHVAMGVTMVVLEVDRVVVPVSVDPFVEIGFPLQHSIGRAIAVFFDVGPRIEVEVIV
jgi:hypothetical protein